MSAEELDLFTLRLPGRLSVEIIFDTNGTLDPELVHLLFQVVTKARVMNSNAPILRRERCIGTRVMQQYRRIARAQVRHWRSIFIGPIRLSRVQWIVCSSGSSEPVAAPTNVPEPVAFYSSRSASPPRPALGSPPAPLVR